MTVSRKIGATRCVKCNGDGNLYIRFSTGYMGAATETCKACNGSGDEPQPKTGSNLSSE